MTRKQSVEKLRLQQKDEIKNESDEIEENQDDLLCNDEVKQFYQEDLPFKFTVSQEGFVPQQTTLSEYEMRMYILMRDFLNNLHQFNSKIDSSAIER